MFSTFSIGVGMVRHFVLRLELPKLIFWSSDGKSVRHIFGS